MKRRIYIAFIVVFLVVGKALAVAPASGEEVPSRQASSVVKNLKAPARPDMPWSTQGLRNFSEPLREDHPSELDPQKEYELAELIDLAERTNPETKGPWQDLSAI